MSNPILTHKRIRIKFSADEFTSQKDILTSTTPKMYRGNWSRFEVIVYWNNEIVDLSNIVSLTLEIFRLNRSVRLASKTVTFAEITALPSAANWTAGTAQHAAFDFNGTEMNWALAAGQTEENFFLVLSGITNDTPGHEITYGTSGFTLVEDGAGAAGVPPTNDPLYYNAEDSDARFVQAWGDGQTFRFKRAADGNIYQQFYFQTEGKWRSKIPVIVDGQPTEIWGDPED